MSAPRLGDVLAESRAEFAGWISRHAGSLLRFESEDDLVQAVHLRALQHADSFVWRGREPFFAWLHQVARTHLADRHSHWAALRRRPARLVRITRGGSTAGGGFRSPREPREPGPGPVTLASRRDEADKAVRVLATLSPRDRDLVVWTCDGVGAAEQAARLGVTDETADRARRRALDRFRKAFELASRRV